MNTCVRCGHEGPDEDFLVNKGNVSLSCNKCLAIILRLGGHTRAQRLSAMKVWSLRKGRKIPGKGGRPKIYA